MKLIGILMIVVLFAAVFVLCVRDLGWRGGALVFGGTAITVAWIFLAVHLMTRG